MKLGYQEPVLRGPEDKFHRFGFIQRLKDEFNAFDIVPRNDFGVKHVLILKTWRSKYLLRGFELEYKP